MAEAQRKTPRATAGAVALWTVAAVLVALGIWPEREALASEPSTVRVAGVPVTPREDARPQAVRLARAYLRTRIRLVAAGQRIARTRAALGAQVDAEHLARLLSSARDPRSPLRLVHARARGTASLDIPMPVSIDDERAMRVLLSLKDEIDRAPSDARIDTRNGRVLAERVGRRLDIYATLDAMERAFRDGSSEVRAVVDEMAPARTRSDLAGVRMNAVLGEFETRYSPGDKHRDRTFNLQIAAGKVDGLVVLPGETFDFNEAVGERSEANGFRVANVIADGELVDGVGGGTCQIAGTLHAAVFFAGLPIVERQPHTRPSFYIRMGLDATVSYPGINFRFRNDNASPIVIGLSVRDGIVRAEIRGAWRSRMVTFVRRIDQIDPFVERTIEDPSLPRGVRILAQRGIPGFRVQRFRIVRDVGSNQAVRQRMRDTYPPTTQIWRMGAGAAPPEGFVTPVDDEHPEYVADEYLSLTQGPGIEGTLEQKRPGRSGSYGWIERERLGPVVRAATPAGTPPP